MRFRRSAECGVALVADIVPVFPVAMLFKFAVCNSPKLQSLHLLVPSTEHFEDVHSSNNPSSNYGLMPVKKHSTVNIERDLSLRNCSGMA